MKNLLFEDSYERLFGKSVSAAAHADQFFEAFYRRFLVDSQVKQLFQNTDMKRQLVMLRKSFFHLAGFYVTHQPSNELERLARIHFQLGVGADHYDRWLDCLVATVAEFDPRCDLAVEMAWRWALAPGITYMNLYEFMRSSQPSAERP